MENLLYGLMLVSGNDAAVALSEYIGGSIENFANLMNQKANELGLKSTHFVTPHGLDQDEHYTTAYELAVITDYALKNQTFAKIVRTSNYTININGSPKSLHNTNELLGYLNGVYGVKTGFTNGANRCLVTACKRNNLDIICVVLGCDAKKNRTLDSTKLINYTLDNFSMVNIRNIIDENFKNWVQKNSSSISVNKCSSKNIELILDENQIPFENIAVNKNSLNNISTPISCTKTFEAPLLENSVVGNMEICINNENYFTVDILNKNTIMRKNAFDYLHLFFQDYCYYFSR